MTVQSSSSRPETFDVVVLGAGVAAGSLVKRLGLEPGTPLPRSRDIVFRVTERAAARRQFDRWDMQRLLEWCAPYQRVFVLFGGRFKVAHAKELSLLVRDSDDASH